MKLEELKKNIDLLDYIQDDGNNVKKVGMNKYRVNPCPVCGYFDHFTVYTDTNSYSSFNGCCKGGSIIDFFIEVENMSKREAIKKLKTMDGGNNMAMRETERINSSDNNNRDEIRTLVEEAKANSCDYFQKRGLSNKTISNYKLGYLPDGCKYGKDYKYVLPVSDNYIIVRSIIDTGDRYRNLGSPEIFNVRYLYDSSLTGKEIFITEGMFDALSLEEMGFHAVALNSTTMIEKLIDVINNNKLQLQNKLLVIALDNDQSGFDASKKLKEALYGFKLRYAELNLKDYKDANEFFLEDPELLKKVIESLSLVGTTYEYLLNDFKIEQEKRASEQIIKTGLNNLDIALGGGMYPGLYVLGSVPSLGKTALALQIADNIAGQKQSVLFFSLEMSRYEMTCRSLARMILEHEGDSEITTNHILRATFQGDNINEVPQYKATYQRYLENVSKNITIIEGGFDMDVKQLKEEIERWIGMTGKKPVVFVDYLQVLKPLNIRYTEKQHIDFTILELKRISRYLDLPIIAVSSFNRKNYNELSFVSFKESGAIEYTADVLLGLGLRKDNNDDINDIKNFDPRPLELVILKNRRGKAYESIYLDYKPKQNYFQEPF